MFQSRKHKLPVEWARMCNNKKTWASWSEDTIQKAAAAWHWLHYYVRERGASLPPNCTIGIARWSKLVLPETLLFDVEGERYFASLGNRLWGALASPLRRFQQAHDDGHGYYYTFTDSAIEYIHIVDPSKWKTIPYRACRLELHGVVLKEIGAGVGLIKSSLMSSHKFTQKDLQMFAALYELDGKDSNDAVFLLDILGNHLKGGEDEESYPDLIKRRYTASTCEVAMLLKDPLMEMVFEDMPDDDKGEFPEIK